MTSGIIVMNIPKYNVSIVTLKTIKNHSHDPTISHSYHTKEKNLTDWVYYRSHFTVRHR